MAPQILRIGLQYGGIVISRVKSAIGQIFGSFFYGMTSQPINDVGTGIFENALKFNADEGNTLFSEIGFEGDFTISLWVKSDEENFTIFSNDSENFYIKVVDGSIIRVNFSGDNDVDINPRVDINNNEWHHLVIVRLFKSIEVFVDGISARLVGDDGPFLFTNIARDIDNNYFNISIDELAIWNIGLLDPTLLYNYGLGIDAREVNTDNLQLYYKFNESGFSQVVLDLSANLNHGTLVNFPLSPWTVRDVENDYDFGRGLEFTGTESVSIPSLPIFSNSNSFSLWFNMEAWGDVILHNSDGANSYILINQNDIRVGGTVFSFPSMTLGEWYHLVVSFQSTGELTRVYINGVESTTGQLELGGTIFTQPNINTIGAGYGGATLWPIGKVDDFAAWLGTILTADQALALYNGGKGVDPRTVIADPNRYYDFNELNNTLTLTDKGTDLADGTLVGFTPSPWIVEGLRSLGVAEEVVYPPISLATGTVSVWVTTSNEFFYVLNSTSDTTSGLWIDVLSAQVAIRRNNSTIYFFNEDYTSLIQPFEQYHLFVVFSTNTISVYINGIFISTENRSGSFLIENSFESFGSVSRGNIKNLIIKSDYEGTSQNAIDIYNLGLNGDGSIILTVPDRYYKFDETSGDIAKDSSANNADGVLLNFPTDANHFAPHFNEYFENALEFDGNGYVELPSQLTLSTGTISVWFVKQSGGNYILSSAANVFCWIVVQAGGGNIGIRFNSAANQLYFVPPITLTTGEWYHLTITFNGTTANCYVNGIASSTNPFTYPAGGFDFHILYLSRLWETSTNTNTLDELAIWNGIEATQEQVIALYNNGLGVDPTTVLGSFGANDRYYRFNGVGTQTVALDSSGNGQHGTLVNFPTNGMWVAHTPSDIFFKRALRFNGAPNIVDFIDTINLTGAFTISQWAKPQAYKITLSNGNTNHYALYFQSATILAVAINNQTGRQFTVPAYSFNQWHHVVITRDEVDNLRVYLNGVESITGAINTLTSGTLTLRAIGDFSSLEFDGEIDEVVIWDGVAATAEQAAHLYNEGRGRLATDVINDPILYLPFNGQDGDKWAEDISGNNNHGELIGFDDDPWVDSERVLLTPAFDGVSALKRIEDEGKLGNDNHLQPHTGIAGDFDGLTSLITLPQEISLSGTFIILIKFNTSRLVINQCALLGNSVKTVNYIELRTDPLKIRVRNDEALHDFVFPELTENTWYSLVVTRDSDDNVRTYLNGVESSTGALPNSGDFDFDNIFTHIGLSLEYEGKGSDVLFVSQAPTLTQISQLINNPEFNLDYLDSIGIEKESVKAWFPLTEGAGSVVLDHSLYGNHGTWTSPAYVTNQPSIRQIGMGGYSKYAYFGATGANQNIETSWFLPTTGIYTFRGSYIFTDDVDRYVIHAEKESIDFVVGLTNNFSAATGNIGIGIYRNTFKNYEFTGFTAGDLIEWELVVNLDTEEPISATINGEFQSVFTTTQKMRAQGGGNSEPLNIGGFLPTATGRDFVGLIFYTEVEFNGSLIRKWVNKGKSSDAWKDEIIGEPVLTNTLTTEVILPEQKTNQNVFGLPITKTNLVGNEKVLVLDSFSHALIPDQLVDIKQLQVWVKPPTAGTYADILLEFVNPTLNKILYYDGAEFLSEYATTTILIDNEATPPVGYPEGWNLVTIEFTVPYTFENIYINGVDDGVLSFGTPSEFSIDNLNLFEGTESPLSALSHYYEANYVEGAVDILYDIVGLNHGVIGANVSPTLNASNTQFNNLPTINVSTGDNLNLTSSITIADRNGNWEGVALLDNNNDIFVFFGGASGSDFMLIYNNTGEMYFSGSNALTDYILDGNIFFFGSDGSQYFVKDHLGTTYTVAHNVAAGTIIATDLFIRLSPYTQTANSEIAAFGVKLNGNLTNNQRNAIGNYLAAKYNKTWTNL